MSKTPEQMAEEYAADWHKNCDYPPEILKHTLKATETTFLNGYSRGRLLTLREIERAQFMATWEPPAGGYFFTAVISLVAFVLGILIGGR